MFVVNPQIEFGWQCLYHTRTPASLQTSFNIIYLLARSFFDARQQTDGMTCQWLWLVAQQLSSHMNYIIIDYIFHCLYIGF